jgi:hypothetical protein
VFVFAHLRKCAGTSVIRAARDSGMILPAGHRNGHPAGPDGKPLVDLAHMSEVDIGAMMKGHAEAGVELLAIEWDFPRIEKFPKTLGLEFFTIFRDPVERLISNYRYDFIRKYTSARSLKEYIGSSGIWSRHNYFVRYFCALLQDETIERSHVDHAIERVRSNFRFAFFDQDIESFLRDEVGLPIGRLGHKNRTSVIGQIINLPRFFVSPAELRELQELNAPDYRLYDALRSFAFQKGWLSRETELNGAAFDIGQSARKIRA